MLSDLLLLAEAKLAFLLGLMSGSLFVSEPVSVSLFLAFLVVCKSFLVLSESSLLFCCFCTVFCFFLEAVLKGFQLGLRLWIWILGLRVWRNG